MTSMDRWIERHARRLMVGRFLERSAEWLAGFLLAFGSVILLVKLLFPALWPNVLFLLLATVPVLAASWLFSRRGAFTRADSVMMLDRDLQAGGMLMTLSEVSDERWAHALPQAEAVWNQGLPKVRPVRFFRYLAIPLLFAVAAGFIPPREVQSEENLRVTVGVQAANQLEEMLDLMEKADVIEEKEKQQLRDEINKLKEETRQKPLTHEKWETVDTLRERLSMRLDTTDLTVSKALAAAGTLAKAQQQGRALDEKRVDALEKDIMNALKMMSKSGALSKASPSMRSTLKRLAKRGRFKPSQNPAERKKLLSSVRKLLEKECKRLGECRTACKQCAGGMCLTEGFGKKNGGLSNTNRPGRGGVTRGRGDAELSAGEESDLKGTRFKDVVLPPHFFDKPNDDVVTTTPRAPEVKPAAAAPGGPRRAFDPASGKNTWNRRLHPRHRGVVRQYFKSKTNKSKTK